MHKTFDRSTKDTASDTRRAWVRPTYQRMRAGDAEGGPNPITLDGSFSKS